MPLNPRVVRTLRRYLSSRRRFLERFGRPDEKALFLNARGFRANPNNLQNLMRSIQGKAKLKTKVTAVVLRNSIATELVSRGMDLRIVQDLLGLKSLVSTFKFSRIAKAPLRKVYEKTHPRA